MNERQATLPTISIIVAVYNGAETLQRCIASVAGQTYAARELIVIDGGSSDASVDIIRAHQSTIAYWASEPDKGIYNAWNKGLALARGEWICFLGADDWFAAEDVLSQLVQAIDGRSEELVYGQVLMVNRQGAPVAEIGADWTMVNRWFWRGSYCLPTPGVFHHRALFQCFGLFDENYRIAGDYEFQMRVLQDATPLYLPKLLVTYMQQGGVSSTPQNAMLVINEIQRALLSNDLPVPYWAMRLITIKAWLRIWMLRLLGERIASHLLDFGRQLSGKSRYWSRLKGGSQS